MKYQLTESRKISLITQKSKWAVFVNCIVYGAIIAVPVLILIWVYTNTFIKFPTAIFSEEILGSCWWFGTFVLICNILYLLYMICLVRFGYKEVPLVEDEKLPSCAVIIPAYNEGEHVMASLNSILEADYPVDKLEIIAVDDGSTDDTWEYISQAAEKSNGRIKAIKQPCNQGKRFAIYAGIMLDTKDFATRTGVRTFEAAAYLKRCDVDIDKVRKFFKNDFESYIKIAKIIYDAEIIKNKIAISCSYEAQPSDMRVMAAQAADKLLSVNEVEASFVIMQLDSEITVSGRSIGNINVQVIMEKLGGGGHQTMAGAQFKDMSLDEVRVKLLSVISEYFEEVE